MKFVELISLPFVKVSFCLKIELAHVNETVLEVAGQLFLKTLIRAYKETRASANQAEANVKKRLEPGKNV